VATGLRVARDRVGAVRRWIAFRPEWGGPAWCGRASTSIGAKALDGR